MVFLLNTGASSPKLERLSTDEIQKLIASGNVVVLNFWATWCEPCVEEIPIFRKLQANHQEIIVIGISMDDLNIENKIQRFITEHRMNYRVAIWTGNDFEQMVDSIDPGWDGPIPATFIFRKGKLVYSRTGPVTEAELLKQLS
jgi:thiol-disulfide isomerase/thioredoxin